MFSSRLLSAVLIAFAVVAAPVSSASAQQRAFSILDANATTITINRIERYTNNGFAALDRLQTQTDRLLTSLDDRGATTARLESVAGFYVRSTTAVRVRTVALIERDYRRQSLVLRSRAGSEEFQALLDAARDEAINDMLIQEADTIAAISASLAAVLNN